MNSGDVRHHRVIELADGADENGALDLPLAAGILDERDPAPAFLVEARRQQPGAEADVRPDAELLGGPFQIVENLLAVREIAAPAVAASEGEGIGVVRRVDAAAGIAIDVPGAAEIGVLFDDLIGDA